MKFNWQQFKEKWIKRTYKPRSFKSVEEMMDEVTKEAFLEGIYNTIRRFFKRLFEAPMDFIRNVKWDLQRAERGWSDCDAWGTYSYLAKVIKETCQYIRKHKHGVPMGCFKKNDPVDETGNFTDEAMERADVRWGEALDDIIFTFDTLQKVEEYDLIMPFTKRYFNTEEIIKWQKYCDSINGRKGKEPLARVMTKEEFKRYNRGWKLFRKHFQNLWD